MPNKPLPPREMQAIPDRSLSHLLQLLRKFSVHQTLEQRRRSQRHSPHRSLRRARRLPLQPRLQSRASEPVQMMSPLFGEARDHWVSERTPSWHGKRVQQLDRRSPTTSSR